MERKDGIWSWIVEALNFLSQAMAVSGLLLLGCIPVVTAGASCAAAYYAAVKALRGQRGGIWSCYWHSFRQNLRQGILLSLLMLCVGGLLAFYRFAMGGVEAFSALYFGLVALLGVVFLAALVWLFPLLSRYAMPAGRLLVVSILLAAGHPLRTLGAAAMVLAAVFLTALAPPLILLLPGLHCWGVSFLQEPALRRLAKDGGAGEKDEDPWYRE